MRSVTADVVVVVRSLVLLLSLETLSIPTTATSCMMVAAALLLLLLCDKPCVSLMAVTSHAAELTTATTQTATTANATTTSSQ
eukprot:9485-Heterococcus_DN1.PRE.1